MIVLTASLVTAVTFSASLNTASYSNMRCFINNYVKSSGIRIEELVNYLGGGANADSVSIRALSSPGEDRYGLRKEFAGLVEKYKKID